jgi:polysaccharide export outer membrane protein
MNTGSSLRVLASRSAWVFLSSLFCIALNANVAAQCPYPGAPRCPQLADAATDLPDGLNGNASRPAVHQPQYSPSEIQYPNGRTLESYFDEDVQAGSRSHPMNSRPDASPSSPRPAPRQPDALTEFQQFVLNSTGKKLPVFGAELFQSEHGAQYGLIERGPAPPEMIIGPDDELRLRVSGQVNLSTILRVSREGEIYIARVGTVHVAGLPFGQVAGHIRSAMDHVYRNFDLSVEIGQIHSVQVYVTGYARDPGEYAVSALSSLVDALFIAGGPSSVGSMRHVQLRRQGTVVTDFDLYNFLIHGDKTGDAQLQAGDVLFIPPAGAQVAVLGSVRQPAIFELRGEESVRQILDAAGGRTAVASDARISLERIEDHSHRRAVDLASDDAALGTCLRDGDMVRVDSIASRYQQTVTLRGAVAAPGHFAWREGLRLSQLLPDRESLVKRDYWWERTQLGVPGPEFKAVRLAPDFPSDPANKLSPSFPDKLLAVGETSQPLIVERSSYQTNWNYAVVERLNHETMRTSLIPFNLGKLVLEHDPSADMALEPGDVVTIFMQSDIKVPAQEEIRYVTLEGEFVHPGVYSVTPTETLRELIQRAGGLTSEAYVYASTFTRRSTRELEAEHLRDLTDEMEHQLIRKSVIGVSGEQDSQSAGLNRELLTRLQNVHATGRIVLNVESSRFPELHLEDGDRLLVPPRPDTVQVLGAVFNPHAFIYHDRTNAQDYLKMAGGPKRDADKKHIYVLRANGSVSVSESIFGNDLKKVTLSPGDSVIVPEKQLRRSSVAEVLAWSQALSQASVTALAATAATK